MTEIWIVEDNDLFRNTVSRALDVTDGFRCKATFSGCEAALERIHAGEKPRVLLLDIGLPGMNGIDGLRAIKQISPEIDVIMLTIHDDPKIVIQAICAGASGYLLKTSSLEFMKQSIREVVNGGATMSPGVARTVLNLFTKIVPAPKDYGLTPREGQTLELLVTGLSKKQVASELSVSFHTVDKHMRGIYEKLQVHSVSGAVAKALRENLV